jgi:tetratricopeptide (TPR) repeat protein
MKDQNVKSIIKQLEYLETNDLLDIWQKHDNSQWTSEGFEAIRQILLSRKIKIPPHDDRVEAEKHIKLAEDFLASNEPHKALSECNLAIKLAPRYAYAYFEKGDVLDELERLDEAIKFYENAIKLDPDLSEAKRSLHWALEDAGKKATTSDERILAALSHGGIILSVIGLLLPAIVWITQREKSRYVAFHSLQALGFQLLAAGFSLFSGIFTIICNLISSTGFTQANTLIPWFTILIGVFALIQVIFIIRGFMGAIASLLGKPFRYLWISRKLEKFLLF